MEYQNYIKDFKQSLQTQIGEFVFKTEDFINQIKKKESEFCNLQEEIDDKQSEISNYNKVSFVKQLDKQLEQQKKDTRVYKLRIRSLQKRIQNLEKKNQQLQKGLYDYTQLNEIFDKICKQKRMNKNKIIEEVKKLYFILNNKEYPIEKNEIIKKQKNKDKNKEPIKEKVIEEPIKEKVIEEPIKEKCNYVIMNDRIQFEDTVYRLIEYKKKVYYLDQESNIVYRKKKSGRLGKKYGTINDKLLQKV